MRSPANHLDREVGYPALPTAMIGLAGLMIACFFSFLDRQILALLVQPIKHDLGITDTQIGVLQGIAFALSYSVLAIPFGWMADRYNRVRLVCFGLATWSVATVSMGFSNSFTELLVGRVLVGAGEATLMPAAYSLLADYFPPRQRGRAFAAYTSAVFLGNGAALVGGGGVLGLLHGMDTVWLPLLGAMPIWKAAFIVLGAPGLGFALLLLLLPEPLRQDQPPPDSKEAVGMTAYVGRHRHAFFTVLGIYSLLALVGYAMHAWAPTLLIRNYGLQPHTAGLAIGVGMMASGLAAAVIAGVLGDRWVAQGRRGGRLSLTFPLWILGFPALVLFGLSGDIRWAIMGFTLYGLLLGVGFVPWSAVMQEMVPGNLRGRTTAVWYLVTGIIGNGFGPVLTGAVNDRLFRSESALPLSLLTVAGPCLLLGLILTITGMDAYDKARGKNKILELSTGVRKVGEPSCLS